MVRALYRMFKERVHLLDRACFYSFCKRKYPIYHIEIGNYCISSLVMDKFDDRLCKKSILVQPSGGFIVNKGRLQVTFPLI